MLRAERQLLPRLQQSGETRQTRISLSPRDRVSELVTKKTRIIPKHLQFVIRNDKVLNKFFAGEASEK